MYSKNEHLFDTLACPRNLDKTLLIFRILLRGADFEPAYPDVDFLTIAIKGWSESRLRSWERLATMHVAQYNPLENYDMRDQYTDTNNGKTTGTTTANVATSESNTDEEKVSAYNANDYQPSRQNLGNNSGNSNTTSNSSGTSNNTLQHEQYRHGNIGVMSTQDLITQEAKLWTEYDVYDVIASEFVDTFCVQIY